MNRLTIAVLLSLTIGWGVSANAQSGPSLSDYEMILLPVGPKLGVPGAFGSLWEAVLSIHNSGDSPVHVFHSIEQYFCLLSFPCEVGDPLEPGATATTLGRDFRTDRRFVTILTSKLGPGALLFVEKDKADAVFLNVKVRDVTSQQWNQGTEIPVVREGELFTGTVDLLNLNLPPTARGLLRLYTVPTLTDPTFAVRVFSLIDGELLAETVITLPFDVRPNFPRYAEVSLREGLLAVPEDEHWLRVRMEPLNAGFRYWAFVTATNNETQTISLTTPQ
jgi:hypothetical protein